jgi:hypothetical protein
MANRRRPWRPPSSSPNPPERSLPSDNALQIPPKKFIQPTTPPSDPQKSVCLSSSHKGLSFFSVTSSQSRRRLVPPWVYHQGGGCSTLCRWCRRCLSWRRRSLEMVKISPSAVPEVRSYADVVLHGLPFIFLYFNSF